jgi:hypothetical protein
MRSPPRSAAPMSGFWGHLRVSPSGDDPDDQSAATREGVVNVTLALGVCSV